MLLIVADEVKLADELPIKRIVYGGDVRLFGVIIEFGE